MTTLRLSTVTTALATWFVDALAPPACAACDQRLDRRAVFCAACAGGVVSTPPATLPAPSGAPLVAFALYGGPLATALRRLKYSERPDLAGPLGQLARRAARAARLAGDLVVPVPLHPRRLAERGYNQAALIAHHAARELEVPLGARALIRVRNTPPQARLDRAARLTNAAGAFRARSPATLSGKRIVLVDDVATTGSTLAACTGALLAAGALSVSALVVARAE